jgi:hypothetical protein
MGSEVSRRCKLGGGVRSKKVSDEVRQEADHIGARGGSRIWAESI